MSFTQLGLQTELLKAVSGNGYTKPTPIQNQAIPLILKGHDLMGGSQTGTGKTAAFVLPMLQILSDTKRKNNKPRALILTPTRELAAQVGESVVTYGRGMKLSSTIIFGGVGMMPQIKRLRRGVDILIATPGRLLDHQSQRNVDLSQVEILVLDEADRMLDMGFIPDIRRILKCLPRHRQNLMFSATYSNAIKKLADTILDDPAMVEVARRNTAAESVKQIVHPVAKPEKRSLLTHLIWEGDWKQVLVFARTKHGANRLARQLEMGGISAGAIHGNKTQSARTKALADFKAGRVRVLVGTDVASRGLDIDRLPHVVNFELPNVPEDYVHRIGRTGRAGEDGAAHSLVSPDEKPLLRDIENLLKRSIPVEKIEGFGILKSNAGPRRSSGGRTRNNGNGGNRNGGRNRSRRANSKRHSEESSTSAPREEPKARGSSSERKAKPVNRVWRLKSRARRRNRSMAGAK